MSDRRELQGTVFRIDRDTGSGSVVLDDGSRLDFAAESVDASLRGLRPGQRVRLRVEAGQVAALTILTLPLPARSRRA